MSVVKQRRVYKYGTGQVIPDGAKYLNTVTQTSVGITQGPDGSRFTTWEPCWLVWHYYEVWA